MMVDKMVGMKVGMKVLKMDELRVDEMVGT